MANIIGENFDSYVANQINIRQKVHGSGTSTNSRNDEKLAYLNSKTAWIKLASGVSIDNRDWEKEKPYQHNRVSKENINTGYAWMGLAKHNVLFGGIARLNNKKLIQRGTDKDSNNIWDWYKGTYNISATSKDNSITGDFGLVPMPGIISTDIKCLNRGSIKKAVVNIKCYSPEQFKIIDLLYLRIGYTVFLEWGWSSFFDNKGILQTDYYTLIEADKGFFDPDVKTYSQMLKKIQAYKEGKCGNYDGFLGKVANFSWTFGEDGSYDIQLNLISIGDVIESLKINIIPSRELSKFIEQTYSLYNEEADSAEETETEKNTKPTPINNLISAYLFLQKLYSDSNVNAETGIPKDVILNPEKGHIKCKVNNTLVPMPGWFIKPPKDGIFVTEPIMTNSPYFFWKDSAYEWLENSQYKDHKIIDNTTFNLNFIADNIIGVIDEQLAYSDGKSFAQLINSGIGYHWLIATILTYEDPVETNYKDSVYIAYNDGSNDEDTMLSDLGFYMRLGHLFDFINEYAIPKTSTVSGNVRDPLTKIDSGQWTNYMYVYPYQISVDPRVCIVNGGEKVNSKEFFPELKTWKNIKKGYGYIMNIYVNHKEIQSCLESSTDDKGNVALFDFVSNLCTSLNKALGGVNNLEAVINEDEIIQIIDSSLNLRTNRKAYGLELYGYNPNFNSSTFVRDFEIKTEMTNDFATMATVGSTAGGYVKGTENTMFSKWNRGLIDRFKEKLVPGNKASRNNPTKIDEPNELYVKEFWNKYYSPFGGVLMDVEYDVNSIPDILGLDDNIIDKNIAIVTEFYKYGQSEVQKEKEKYASPTNGFIPISLSITMDGLSGIKIYNAINVETRFLPANYPDSLKFIVKGVNHSLKENDWETNIETVVISQNEE